jgi:hypothetical protein
VNYLVVLHHKSLGEKVGQCTLHGTSLNFNVYVYNSPAGLRAGRSGF